MKSNRVLGVAGVTVRTAAMTDLDAVARIERESFSEPWSRRSFVDLVGAPEAAFFVAVDAAMVLGYAVMLAAADQSELVNLATAKASRGRGIGRQLLDTVVAEAKSRGGRTMFLEVRRSNAGAQALYRSVGFREIAMRKGYYQQPVEDALVLRLDLSLDGRL